MIGRRFPLTGYAVLPIIISLAVLVPISIHYAPLSRASGVPGAISFSPTSGPAGTQVTVSINPPAGTYTLSATTTSPTSGGCATARPLPGIAPVSVSENGGGTTFTWPSAFSQGAYWLCGTPQGPGQIAASRQPFQVIAPGAPTPTSPAYGPTATIQINAPAAGVVVGSSFTVHVIGWSDASGEPPLSVSLSAENPTAIPTDGEQAHSISVPSTITAQDAAAGTYTFSITIPTTIVPETYWLSVDDGTGSVTSKRPLKVLAATTHPFIPTEKDGGGSSTSILPFAILGVVLLLGIVSIVVAKRGMAASTSKTPPPRYR